MLVHKSVGRITFQGDLTGKVKTAGGKPPIPVTLMQV